SVMCLFSQSVRHVSKTRIFAGKAAAGAAGAAAPPPKGDPSGRLGSRQFLAYSMTLDADGDLAMVLPIPVPVGSDEDAVKFVDMSKSKHFFDQLDVLFPQEQVSRGGELGLAAFAVSQAKPILEVHSV